MTRKTLGYVRLEWTCPRCGIENLGPQKFCHGCGGPQPADVEFHQADEEKLLTEAEELARAAGSPDIHCPYCQARNPGSASFCGACGGALEGGQARSSGRVLGAHRDQPAEPVACPSCATLNSPAAHTCSQCGASLAPAPAAAAAPPSRSRRTFPTMLAVLAGGMCLLVALASLFFLLRREELNGEVARVAWEIHTPIEALRPVERHDWIDRLPAEAEPQRCEQRLRETRDEPEPGAREVCGTPYTVDQGSGYGEVVQDCVYEVYAEWCTYTALEWQTVHTLSRSGDDLLPRTPVVAISQDQRAGSQQARFTVFFSVDGDMVEHVLEDAQTFAQFVPGSNWTLTVNALGGVISAEPAE
jgi:hypothetical protein